MQRIGVFVCWCGSNIAATVDVNAVSEALAREPGVVFSTNYQYMCSESGQNLIKDAIKEHQLTGVVICSCSPRMHEATFRKTVAAAGLNSYMLEIANIREQCSWIHKDKAEATEKAIILGRAAIAKVQLNAPLTPGTSPVTKRALVIGGGIAGIQTALDIADAGFEVDIVEKQPTIGGKMTQIDKTFPTLDCAACILTPKMVDCAQNEKINIFAYSEVEEVKGFVGSFTVKIKKKARYVDPVKCTGCGECTEKCPMKKIPNEFNLGLDTRRAIYIPFAQAVPKVATIDPDHCNMLKNGKCGLCAKVCSAGAIDYKQKDEIVERDYGAIVVATGAAFTIREGLAFSYGDSHDDTAKRHAGRNGRDCRLQVLRTRARSEKGRHRRTRRHDRACRRLRRPHHFRGADGPSRRPHGMGAGSSGLHAAHRAQPLERPPHRDARYGEHHRQGRSRHRR